MWNDRRLARRAARGDQDAFAAIFRRYEQDLYRYCVAILGDRQDAQDALQNTMVKALRALPGERREIELKPWLYRVAHNESIELRRRARPSEPLDEDLGAPIASLEETAAERTRLRDLLTDIGELSERHRGALVMRELGGLDFDQIGEALDTSPGAARQVLYEARRSLQQMSDGREMNCDAVTALLSDGDGRVARRRDVRAHLRDCSECRGFADGIRDRTATLAGIAPLPAIAAAAVVKGALTSGGATGVGAGAGSGGASGVSAAGSVTTSAGSSAATGSGVAAGSGGAGAAGLAGGVAKVASTGAILKSTAAIVAVVGAGAVAVDHSHLFGGHSSGTNSPATVAKRSSGDAVAHGAVAEPSVARSDASHVLPARRFFRANGASEVGLTSPRIADRPASAARGHDQASSSVPARAQVAASSAGSPEVASEAKPTAVQPAAPQVERPAHPEQPAHPARPDHPARPERLTNPSRPVQPTRPSRPANVTHPTRPSHPAHPTHPSQPAKPTSPEPKHEPKPESKAKPEAPPAPEKVETAPEAKGGSKATDEAAADGDTTSEAETADPEPSEAAPSPGRSGEAPGQVKK